MGTSREKLYQELGLESPQNNNVAGNYAISIVFLKTNHSLTLITSYQPLIMHTGPEILMSFLTLLSILTFKIPF